jgi:hypothetical protein
MIFFNVFSAEFRVRQPAVEKLLATSKDYLGSVAANE